MRYPACVARLRGSSSALVEAVGADLVALAQAHALDATTFPYQSLPPVFGGDAPPTLWIARAMRGGPVVGFIATRAHQRALDISGLAVEPPHQRKGLGRALLRAALRSARTRGLATAELHVSTGNTAAIALYEVERFRKVRRMEGYYRSGRFPDGGDAWLMIRDVR
jgi:ribosomal protein S18 acetylase RimI-like enzyme